MPKMDFAMLQRPICYRSFKVKENLLRCSRCKCAWYTNKEEQKAHWKIHKTVCKEPDFTMVSKLSGEQCFQLVQEELCSLKLGHNTAVLLESLYRYLRELRKPNDHKRKSHGMDIYDYGLQLHSFTRLSSGTTGSLDMYYKRAWAIPGMPQFLYFTDLKSLTYTKIVERFPTGRPSSDSVDGDDDFETLNYDDTGEVLGWFVIGFLIRSCVVGPISLVSTHDGQGNLRNYEFCKGAIIRVAEICARSELRSSAMKSMYPVSGFFLNIAQNQPDVMIEVLNVGAFPGIIEWADQQYCLDLLKIIARLDTKKLNEEIKFDMLASCCSTQGYNAEPLWYSGEDDEKITNVCVKIAAKILADTSDVFTLLKLAIQSRRERDVYVWKYKDFGQKRIVLAFLLRKVSHNNGNSSLKLLKGWLNEWKMIKDHRYPEFAVEVMDTDMYEEWLADTKDNRAFYEELELKEAGVIGKFVR